jgi:uncharacterized protein YegJ (DUF2314 family)
MNNVQTSHALFFDGSVQCARRLGLLICLVHLSLMGCSHSETGGNAGTRQAGRDNFTIVDDEDPEMEAAIARGRATLPRFWKALENPMDGETNFALKVEVRDAKGTEFFWANDIEMKDGKIYGVINNEPNIVECVKFGQKIEITDSQIADWLFLRNGKMAGNYTVRPLLKTMPKEEAAKLKAIIEEP